MSSDAACSAKHSISRWGSARTDRKDAIRPRHPRSYQRLKSHRIRVRFTLTFQIAESMGFKGEFRQWEHLLRIAE